MPKSLSENEVEAYRERGYHFPLDVLSQSEVAEFRGKLEDYEARSGGPIKGEMRHRSHVLFPWINEMIRHPRILDAIEDLLGPDILCWNTSFFIKEPRNKSFVSWHQDLTYWGLEPADIVTAWIALSDSTHENGAMRVVPGSHTLEVLPHADTFAPENLLSRGQEIRVEVDAAKAVTLELAAGEMSLHHVKLIHGSEPNPSPKRRIGFQVPAGDPSPDNQPDTPEHKP